MRQLLPLAVLLVACVSGETASPTNPTITSSVSPEVSPTVPPSQAAPEAAGCPVTLPASSWVADLARVAPLPASRFSWYGDNDKLAVDLPIDGVYRVPGPDFPNLGAKIAWWRYLAGTVDITARRLHATAPEIRTKSTEGYGGSGFNSSAIEFTSEGCWRVTGSLQGHELSFVMLVRRAAPGESAP
jgi:hypothetical protein